MKYLKRFNEELSPELLRKYADAAEEEGGYHKTDRAPALRAYADEIAAKEAERAEIEADNYDLEYWKKEKEKSKKNGVIKLELETGKRKKGMEALPNYIGEFHPVVLVGVDMFNDNLDYCEDVENEDIWFTIFINAVVTTEEGLNEMVEAIYEHDKNNSRDASRVRKYREGGVIRMAFADIQINLESGTFKLGPFDFYANDDVPCDVHILDRPSSGLIRTTILKEFNDNDEPYKIRLRNQDDTTKFEDKIFYGVEEAIDGMFAKYGIGTKYGISYQDIYDVIKSTPANKYTI